MNTLPLLAGPPLSLEFVLYVALGIFCLGVYGVLSRRNILVILMCLELMLNGANLALVALARANLPPAAPAGWAQGLASANGSQAFVVMVLAVAAAEAGVGLAILLAAYRRFRTADSGEISLLSG
jgi:NADH-quinone oxidoreductase subunit K